MALTLNTLPSLAFAYTDKLRLEATESTMTSVGSYLFEVTVGTPFSLPMKSFVVRPNPQMKGILDLSPIVTELIESNVYYNNGSIHNLPDLLANVSVTVKSRNGAGTTIDTEVTPFIRLLNGIDVRNQEVIINGKQYFEGGLGQYIWTGGTYNFLTKQKGVRAVTLKSKIMLTALRGYFTGLGTSNYNGIRVRAYQENGTSSFVDTPFSAGDGIISVDVSPDRFTSIINANTLYYEVQPVGGGQTIFKYKMDRGNKINSKYCFLYVNSLGTTDSIDFTKVAEESLNISKDAIQQGYTRKQINTEARQTIDVYSDWMSEEVSHGLKDFWKSPRVVLKNSFYNEYHEVILRNSSVTIQNKHNANKLIQYRVSFEFAETYKTQRN